VAKGLVAVLGSFDTWSYLDYLSRIVAREGYVARTSRFEYALDVATNQVERTDFHAAPGENMIHFLRDTVIAKSEKAIIAYSVSAGHYNEVDWCASLMKPSLAIAFVRDVEPRLRGNHCSELMVASNKSHSSCGGGIRFPDWTAWHCIQASPCPFKEQGISKNQLEYFHQNNRFMHLFAVEEIANSDPLVQAFLGGTLMRPGYVVSEASSSYWSFTPP